MYNSIYPPEQDSFLMSNFLRKNIPLMIKQNFNMKVLEIGAGSGINLNAFLDSGVNKKNIFSCDVNSEAVEYCRNLGFNCVKSNLFEKIFKNKKFDLIIFNPPYLPEDVLEPEDSKVTTTGGLKGNEIIIEFLKQATDFLVDNGKIFLITSSLSERVDFEKLGYKFKLVGEKKLFFEKLFLWELEDFIEVT